MLRKVWIFWLLTGLSIFSCISLFASRSGGGVVDDESDAWDIGKIRKITLDMIKIKINKLGRLVGGARATKARRIFCMILTTPQYLSERAVYVQQSWAHQCDKHVFVTTIPELLVLQDPALRGKWKNNETIEFGFVSEYLRTLGQANATNRTEDILTTTLPLFQPAGFQKEVYQRLSQKLFLGIMAVSQHYPDYDWYLKADDDTMIFMDNLRDFLADKDSSGNFTYGYDYKVSVDTGYHSGGAGYVLPRQAVLDMGSKLTQNFTACETGGAEDIDVAKCLKSLGYIPGSSLDEKQRERFHPIGLAHHYEGFFPDWLEEYSRNQVKNGSDCCSDSTISFHYIKPHELMIMGDLVKNATKRLTFKDIAVAMGVKWVEENLNKTSL